MFEEYKNHVEYWDILSNVKKIIIIIITYIFI